MNPVVFHCNSVFEQTGIAVSNTASRTGLFRPAHRHLMSGLVRYHLRQRKTPFRKSDCRQLIRRLASTAPEHPSRTSRAVHMLNVRHCREYSTMRIVHGLSNLPLGFGVRIA
jgi:hypothetical protein